MDDPDPARAYARGPENQDENWPEKRRSGDEQERSDGPPTLTDESDECEDREDDGGIPPRRHE
jgi:hypothetical protein